MVIVRWLIYHQRVSTGSATYSASAVSAGAYLYYVSEQGAVALVEAGRVFKRVAKHTQMPVVLTSSQETNPDVQDPLMRELQEDLPKSIAARRKRQGVINAWGDMHVVIGKHAGSFPVVTCTVFGILSEKNRFGFGKRLRSDCDSKIQCQTRRV